MKFFFKRREKAGIPSSISTSASKGIIGIDASAATTATDKSAELESYNSFLSFLGPSPEEKKEYDINAAAAHLEINLLPAKSNRASKPYFTEEDDVARNLDVPVSDVIRQCEQEALRNGNENKGFLSFRNGFLPMLYPEEKLPDTFRAWDEMGKILHIMMSNLTLRPFVENELAVIPATCEELEDRYLFRAALILGTFLLHIFSELGSILHIYSVRLCCCANYLQLDYSIIRNDCPWVLVLWPQGARCIAPLSQEAMG